jgi:hypothetical protein
MRNTARQTRENRTITVDFQHEATYLQLLGDGKAFVEGSCWILGSCMCRGRSTRFFVTISSWKLFFFNGLKNESRL